MDTMEFLDLTGVEDSEIRRIQALLSATNSNYRLPLFISSKSPQYNECIVVNTQNSVNGALMETYANTPNPVKYSPPMTYITLPYTNQIPGMYNTYHYPTPVYTEFNHPQMMNNNGNQVHFMYPPSHIYNYAPQVPVTYGNHSENSQYCVPQNHNIRAVETGISNQITNGELTDYEMPKLNIPHENVISNYSPNINSNKKDLNSNQAMPKPNIQEHQRPVTVSVTPSAAVIKSEDITQKNIEESPATNVWAKKPQWGTVFKKETSITNGVRTPTLNEKPVQKPTTANLIEPVTHRLEEFIMNYKIDGKMVNLQPRGLINKGNYCYINSILQALLACPPLYNLLKGLSNNLEGNKNVKLTPMIDNMTKFIDQFQSLTVNPQENRPNKKNNKHGNVNLSCGKAFEPSVFYSMLNGIRSDSFLIEGRQEDAEEFLGLLLNGLNDEMLTFKKKIEKVENNREMSNDSDDWKIMGPKNKGNITRKMHVEQTPISDIFGGLLCSKIHKTGDESTVNIQPFFTLQLNIEKAKTINEALLNFTSKNRLEGLTSSKTKESVEAWQQVMIEKLPVVLVLHLKCFDYKTDGCTKIMKILDFPIDLKIDSKILSGRTNTSSEKNYRLFAIVYHQGKEASKGHYVADVYHTGLKCWLRYDDSRIKPVSEENVRRPPGYRIPYLLFYRRSDT